MGMRKWYGRLGLVMWDKQTHHPPVWCGASKCITHQCDVILADASPTNLMWYQQMHYPPTWCDTSRYIIHQVSFGQNMINNCKRRCVDEWVLVDYVYSDDVIMGTNHHTSTEVHSRSCLLQWQEHSEDSAVCDAENKQSFPRWVGAEAFSRMLTVLNSQVTNSCRPSDAPNDLG